YHPQDNEYNLDPGFDPVWEAKAVVDSLGWTAEMRIPFSQLRFNDVPVQVWGFNADHWNPATSEDVFWVPVPTNRTGWSSWMGELVGIEGIKPSRRLEVLPYSAGDATFTGRPQPADPFDDGKNLGAPKPTGRRASGRALGALAAVTARETARTYDTATATFARTPAAPPAGYGVARVQQEFGASRSVVGATFTAVHRDIGSTDPLA